MTSDSDVLAERTVIVGQVPDGWPRAVADASVLPPFDLGWVRDDDVVPYVGAYARLIARMRERVSSVRTPTR